MGNILVRVRTSETGSLARAKNVQMMLTLPVILRSQIVAGRQMMNGTPLARAEMVVTMRATPLRAMAVTCQSQYGWARWTNMLIAAKDRLPVHIHRYGFRPSCFKAIQASRPSSNGSF
jgi:hypothetical protein